MNFHPNYEDEGNSALITWVAFLATLKRIALDLNLLIACAKRKDQSGQGIQFAPHDVNAIPAETMLQMEVDKINADRLYLLTVIEATIEEVSQWKSYDAMRNAIDTENRDTERVSEVGRLANARITVDLADLQTEIYSTLEDELEYKFFEQSLRIKYECNFLNNWKAAKREMEEQKIKLMMEDCSNQLYELDNARERELTVHKLCDKFLMDKIAQYRQDIEDWMTKCDETTEELNLSIQKTMDTKRKTIDKHKELQTLFEERLQFINDYKLEKLRNKCAVKIQALWRGTMVRKQLGPYSKKKKKKKGKGKKGAGKKKKK